MKTVSGCIYMRIVTKIRMNNTPCAYLVDASIYVFRAWFTWPDSHKNAQGESVNAVKGFIHFVDELLEQEQPEYIAFAFDESLQNSHRKHIYPAYKANRASAPENLRYQFQLCRRYVRALGMVEAASAQYEADDLLASWAQQAECFTVVSADKDLAQLIGEQDHWYDYVRQVILDRKGVFKKYGVYPEQIADQLALAGDKADNIPGVPGIGMATAAKLLRYFGSLEQLLESIDQVGKMKFRGAAKVQAYLQEHKKMIPIYRQLTGLVTDVEGLERDLSRRSIHKAELKALMKEL